MRSPRLGVRWLIAASVVLAALSLLFAGAGFEANTYDPTVWLIWGREVVHGSLVTSTGSTWKPLPVIFTTVFSLFGGGIAPSLWLIVARAGGLLGLFLAHRVAVRVAGPVAGVVAAVALAVEYDYVATAVQGISEPLMVALALWAIDAHLDGRPRRAFALAVAVALLRPESWPLVGGYALWLAWRERGTPRFGRTAALVLGAGVFILVAWFVPEKIGSGHWLRGADRATLRVPGTPANAAFPFGAVFTNSAQTLVWPVYVGGVAATALAVREWLRRRIVTAPLFIAGLATAYMVIVATLTQLGFTGSLRYVVPPAALVAVLAGVGWATLASMGSVRFGRRAVALAGAIVLAAAVPALATVVDRLNGERRSITRYRHLYADLPRAIERAGGRSFVLRCGTIATGDFQTPPVAYALDIGQQRVAVVAAKPGTILAPLANPIGRNPAFPVIYRDRWWIVRSSCTSRY